MGTVNRVPLSSMRLTTMYHYGVLSSLRKQASIWITLDSRLCGNDKRTQSNGMVRNQYPALVNNNNI